MGRQQNGSILYTVLIMRNDRACLGFNERGAALPVPVRAVPGVPLHTAPTCLFALIALSGKAVSLKHPLRTAPD